uniref:Uncharacterized protein n=2 Tax=Craspedostauros australis TaxID=1486917 RepID=A0A7R9WV87_9STRA|mmetsp:Transcript_22430/g.62583  ORF Transcript_22430/g.62583 Transcript_22430/m.62583 type:complete len:127 (+) Transcript_22430:215-595(+)
MVLRRARTQVEMARRQVEIIEDRHWALLSLYNADAASGMVDEALQEIQMTEPAAKLTDFPRAAATKTTESASIDGPTASAGTAPTASENPLNGSSGESVSSGVGGSAETYRNGSTSPAETVTPTKD